MGFLDRPSHVVRASDVEFLAEYRNAEELLRMRMKMAGLAHPKWPAANS
jgi:hypothetical protein